ncbi:hypothetical protein [Aurantiacibacter hainanensis]|uniref:hypothetical protein n=1 Tax=Aurantiacibacter hainanensis TaxID=3076114 RepID=UPI0030C748E4
MHRLLALTATAAIAAGLAATPAAAQDDAGDRVNQVIIFGDDECPESSGDTITVCARLDESERYRIPPRLRSSDSPENESWTQRALALEAVGDFGPLSCTPVGAGGDLGCTMEMIEAAYAERASSSDVRFAELIAEERAERLATIDAEAAATQTRVEELEEAEFERRRQAQSVPIPGEEVDPSAPPATVVDPERIPPRDLPPPSFDDDDGPVPLDAAPPPAEPGA